MGVPQNEWFVMEIPIKIDDLEGTPISGNPHICVPFKEVIVGRAFRFHLGSDPARVISEQNNSLKPQLMVGRCIEKMEKNGDVHKNPPAGTTNLL